MRQAAMKAKRMFLIDMSMVAFVAGGLPGGCFFWVSGEWMLRGRGTLLSILRQEYFGTKTSQSGSQ